MRNKNILKAFSLLAAVCIAAGCNGSTATETTTTTTTTAVESTTTVTTVAEITTSAEGTDSEISASSQLEIDYVDDDGIIYYKNPTEWTYEKFFSELTINGKSIEAPLTIEKMGEDFSLVVETIEYLESDKVICAEMSYKDNVFATVSLKNCENNQDIQNKEIKLMNISDVLYECDIFPNVLISGVGIASTRTDIISACGVPFKESKTDEPITDTLTYTSESCTIIFRFSNNCVRTMYILLYA